MTKNYILYDGAFREALLPFTYTKPVADIRIGILTIREKWERFLRFTTTTLTEDYLEQKHPMLELDENVFINAGYLPNPSFFKAVKSLEKKQAISCDGDIIAFFSTKDQVEVDFSSYEIIEIEGVKPLEFKWNLFLYNDEAIRQDFELLTQDEISQEIPDYVQVVGKGAIFIEEGAVLNPCILNASNGPIYIAKDAVVLDGAMIRGPFSLGEKSIVKMGAKIYGATTVGPNCRVGGEIKNSILFANSNKGHEGYLGNSVVGEWCNFGADSNISNLKNTYSNVRVWCYEHQIYQNTHELYCGLMMGDHSKTSINTMFNTGTVVGVSANVFSSDIPEKFIPSFMWTGNKINDTYNFKKAVRTAKKMMALSSQELSEVDISILEEVYHLSKKYRK